MSLRTGMNSQFHQMFSQLSCKCGILFFIMKTSVTILSVLLLAAAIVTATKAKSAGGCCVVYTKASKLQKLPLSVIKEYRVQEVTGSCHIPAVVFITQRNRQICANPKAKNVKQILRQLRGKKSNGKDGR